MIHVFHGFLGSTLDFKFLQISDDVILHDLYTTSYSQLLNCIGPKDTLIGYSMGGRIAMELAHAREFSIKQLVLISAHPGLVLEKEREPRRIWEDEVVSRLTESNPQEFIDWWNALAIFEHDHPLTSMDREKQKASAPLFDAYRLSAQKNFMPELREHHEQILYIAGTRDAKYRGIATDLMAPAGISVQLLDGNHRLFQNPDQLLNLLRKEKII